MRNKPPISPGNRPQRAGFALPVVTVVIGALFILAIGAMLIANLERGTARSYVDRQRAELAAQAAIEEIHRTLLDETMNDDYLITQSTLANPIVQGRTPAPHLFITRGVAGKTSDDYTYRHIPLFATESATLSPSEKLAPPTPDALSGSVAASFIDFETLPYLDKVRAAWKPIREDPNDPNSKAVARYAFWVEDLQGKLDPALVGNKLGASGTHIREPYPWPAPGVSPEPTSDLRPAMSEVALFALDPEATETDQKDLGRNLIENRKLLISPGANLFAAGIAPPLERDATGRLIDPMARAIEENTTHDLQPYKERPLIPYAKGIDSSMAGKPKLNLNALVAKGGDQAVEEIAEHINNALPTFAASRKGGFPDDYTKTLAANIIDYADSDSDSTVKDKEYRGLDAYPLVSEFLMRFNWLDIRVEDGRKYVIIEVATYVELWNMSDQVVSGNFQVTYETSYHAPLGVNPEGINLADLTTATPILHKSDGYSWFPAQFISLKSDQYQVVNCGTVTYIIDAGPSSTYIPSPITLEGETYGALGSGYRMKWNGKLVDQSRGNVHRFDASIKYSSKSANTTLGQQVRATIPAHSCTRGTYINNMGDPRMSYYLLCPQDANAYPENYSPNRRNIRYNIYKGDTSKIYGRVMPSEWPDGGHNSDCYQLTFLSGTTDAVNPDAVNFMNHNKSALANPVPEKALMSFPNSDTYLSTTELGRIYDPVMWEIAQPASTNGPWSDVLDGAQSSTDYGGGNTLRVGRSEHAGFDQPGKRASQLLDLFHVGISNATVIADQQGPVVDIRGQININTATREAIRALVYGRLLADPLMCRRVSETHDTSKRMAPITTPYEIPQQDLASLADRIADAIIFRRNVEPFASTTELSHVKEEGEEEEGKFVFGNVNLLNDAETLEFTDAALEENFARIYNSTTTRSRNFRVWVVAQAIPPTDLSANPSPKPLAEVRKCFDIFADPGERNADGAIVPANTKLTILDTYDF